MAKQTIDLGRVGIWTGVLDAVSSREAQERAVELEELGFTTLWIPETVGRDPFVTATLLLAATSKLKIATGIANIYARDPLTMANTQRSLEEAFPGRFLLGLGVSHRIPAKPGSEAVWSRRRGAPRPRSLRYPLSPHSVFSDVAQRPARGDSPAPGGRVQWVQPIEG